MWVNIVTLDQVAVGFEHNMAESSCTYLAHGLGFAVASFG
jgi:hypothetical protein